MQNMKLLVKQSNGTQIFEESQWFESDSDGYCHTKLEMIYTVNDNKDAFLVFITQSSLSTCHACAPVYSLAHLVNQSGRWKVESFQKHLCSCGSYGNGCEYSLKQIGTNRWGVIFESSFLEQGQISEAISIYESSGNKILFAETYGNNGGNIMEGEDSCFWSYSSSWKFVETTDKLYYNLIFTKTGTIWAEEWNEKLNCRKIKPINEAITYIFDEELGVYVKECK